MKLNLTSVIAGALACAVTLAALTETALAAESKITILYDAFGDDAAMKKDWGFSALVEVAGKRILFDTGNDRDIFAANVKAKNIDLTNLDFVVLSHRHSDHMAGLSHVLSVNPKARPRPTTDLEARGKGLSNREMRQRPDSEQFGSAPRTPLPSLR